MTNPLNATPDAWADGLGYLADQARRRSSRVVAASPLERVLRDRLGLIHECLVEFELDLNPRPTRWALGRYYRSRRFLRVYIHDRDSGPRPLEEVFAIFLHEVARPPRRDRTPHLPARRFPTPAPLDPSGAGAGQGSRRILKILKKAGRLRERPDRPGGQGGPNL